MWLDNYIYTQTLPVDFAGLTPPPTELHRSQLDCHGCIISTIGSSDCSRPTARAAGSAASRSAARSSSDVFAHFLDGFGATGSVSYTDYKLKGEAADVIGSRAPGLLAMGLQCHRLLREEWLPGPGQLSLPVGVQGRGRVAVLRTLATR